jgi:hypothetical protein
MAQSSDKKIGLVAVRIPLLIVAALAIMLIMGILIYKLA